MTERRGFTLIEALITTLVLVTGLAAVAAVFSYSSLATLRVLQETAAISMVSVKMEDLKTNEEIVSGRYAEHLVLLPNGVIVPSEPGAATYLRTWEITSDEPNRITVIVYGKPPGRTGPFRELARATTASGRRF